MSYNRIDPHDEPLVDASDPLAFSPEKVSNATVRGMTLSPEVVRQIEVAFAVAAREATMQAQNPVDHNARPSTSKPSAFEGMA